MPSAEAAYVAKIREQLAILRNPEYAYNELHVYVCGIAEPWVFGRADEFELDSDKVMVVRQGPTHEYDNARVPETAFPLGHVVATELCVSGG